MHKILAINPGSTSTKVALYEEEKLLFSNSIPHSAESLAEYNGISDQREMRTDVVKLLLALHEERLHNLSAVVGRGGLLPPVSAGAYLVNPEMVDILLNRPVLEHASNLGGVIAYEIAAPLGIPAMIYDPVTVDELEPIARVAGMACMQRIAVAHNLNIRATAMKYAKQQSKTMPEMNLIVAHLGGGITLALIRQGRIVDIVSDDEGPFSPERSGGLPIFELLKLAYSGQYDHKTLVRTLRGKGGLASHFGTNNAREIENRVKQGDPHAGLIYEAMAYNIAKNIGKLAAAAAGKVESILLTGGLAYSKMLTDWIVERVGFIAPVCILPGENEMEALAFGALRVLRGEEKAKTFAVDSHGKVIEKQD